MSLEDIARERLSERVVGQYPISIPTSLALESAAGILPEAPSPTKPIAERDNIMFNLRTLFRNLLGSMDKEAKKQLTAYTIAEALSAEMRVIEQVVSEISDGMCESIFYHCTYGDLLQKFTKAIPKTINTVAQKEYASTEAMTIKYIKEEFEQSTPPIRWLTREFDQISGRTLLLTHYPIDLLQRYRFDAMSLLESHTGAIKGPMLWNTKLHNGKEFEIIPFDRMTLQMFGDNVTFTPMSLKVRQKVYSIAVKNRWTPATTKDFVIHCIVENRDPALEVLVKDLYRK